MGESYILKVNDEFEEDHIFYSTFQGAADEAKGLTKRGKTVIVCKVIEMALYEPSFTWKPLEGYNGTKGEDYLR